MKKLALLCGLISGLYLPIQAQADEDGYYVQAQCRELKNGCNINPGFCITGSAIGFGFAATEEAAKSLALQACKDRLPKTSPTPSSYTDMMFNAEPYYVLHGTSGKSICGIFGRPPALGNDVGGAYTNLESHNLNKFHDSITINGSVPIYCYDNHADTAPGSYPSFTYQ
ncbi:MAG: hypothetical protein K0R14_817 [Burkholderiales bacterium]|jgi:hypothetical protein|nr:hypothetical protein [Burkholderiales bacterium]